MFTKPTELESINRRYRIKKMYAVAYYLLGHIAFCLFILIGSFIDDVIRAFRRLDDEKQEVLENSNSIDLFNQVQEQEDRTFKNYSESITGDRVEKTTEEMFEEEHREELSKVAEILANDKEGEDEHEEINVFIEPEEKQENNENAGVKLESVLEEQDDEVHLIDLEKAHIERIVKEAEDEVQDELEKAVDETSNLRTGKNFHRWIDKQLLAKIPKNSDDRDSLKHYARILDSDDVKTNLVIEDELIFDEIENEFPNFKEVVQFYKSQFRFNSLTDKNRFQPIILLGDPGIGKTMFARTLAKTLNTGFTYVDMASATSTWVLNGLDASWRGCLLERGQAW